VTRITALLEHDDGPMRERVGSLELTRWRRESVQGIGPAAAREYAVDPVGVRDNQTVGAIGAEIILTDVGFQVDDPLRAPLAITTALSTRNLCARPFFPNTAPSRVMRFRLNNRR